MSPYMSPDMNSIASGSMIGQKWANWTNLIKHSLELHVIFFIMIQFHFSSLSIPLSLAPARSITLFGIIYRSYSSRAAIGIMTTVQHLAQVWHQPETTAMEIH